MKQPGDKARRKEASDDWLALDPLSAAAGGGGVAERGNGVNGNLSGRAGKRGRGVLVIIWGRVEGRETGVQSPFRTC